MKYFSLHFIFLTFATACDQSIVYYPTNGSYFFYFEYIAYAWPVSYLCSQQVFPWHISVCMRKWRHPCNTTDVSCKPSSPPLPSFSDHTLIRELSSFLKHFTRTRLSALTPLCPTASCFSVCQDTFWTCLHVSLTREHTLRLSPRVPLLPINKHWTSVPQASNKEATLYYYYFLMASRLPDTSKGDVDMKYEEGREKKIVW